MSDTYSAKPFAAQAPQGVGIISLNNAGASALSSGVTTFGQAFAAGEVASGSGLVAQLAGGGSLPVQMDVKTRWPDGSVKFAVLTLERPDLAAGRSLDLSLAAAAPPAAPAIDLAQALAGREIGVTLAFEGGRSLAVDVDAALREALAAGRASLWQEGPLATQGRVEIAVPGTSLRLVFDVTAFKGGGLSVDAQFANDRAMEAIGGRLAYTATATLDGREVLRETVNQMQYQSWNAEFSSNGRDGGQGLGSPEAGWLNIRHDVAKLGALGVVADYDLTLSIPESTLAAKLALIQQPGWSAPLATNGVVQYMPMAGGRPDIGITTEPATTWLITQDARAAAQAMGWAETAGAVPWRYWDAANNTWLNAGDYPVLWNQGRYGTGTGGNPNAPGPTQVFDPKGGWIPEAAHQPDLSFVPYLLTGERWILDNLNAQAAWNTLYTWPGGTDQRSERYNTTTGANDLVVRNVEVRAAGWALRQLENAAWAAPDGSAEKAYFRSTADANWKWLVSQIPAWTARQGETAGYLPIGWGNGLGVWQQDYFASTAILAASRGNALASTFLDWMKNFLIGRFEQDPGVFNPRDGVAYRVAIAELNPATGYIYSQNAIAKTWAEIGRLTRTAGWSNGEGWDRSAGNYGMWALSTLAGIYLLDGDPRAKAAYDKLIALSPPYTTAADFAQNPNSAVTIPGEYGGIPGTDPGGGVVNPPDTGGGHPGPPPPNWDGDNDLALTTTIDGRTIDLGTGADKLTLSSSGDNAVTVINVETIIGGALRDVITLARPVSGVMVDLRDGADALTLSSLGPNTLTVANVETVIGGSAADDVTLLTAANDVLIDLNAGTDTLRLSSAGPNRVTLSDVERVVGGSANDTLTFTGSVNGAVIDLQGGYDTVILSTPGQHRLGILNVESVVGSTGNDTVTFDDPLTRVSIDLGDGRDKIQLSSGATNRVAVTNTETVLGGTLGDFIDASRSNSSVILWGNDGADVLIGGSGNDIIAGGQGGDRLSGGAGADNFFYGLLAEAAVTGQDGPASPPKMDRTLRGVDTISDFQSGIDKIVLSFVDANATLPGDQAFRYAGRTDAVVNNSVSWFWDANGNTFVQAELNGDGAADLQIRLTGQIALTAWDFVA